MNKILALFIFVVTMAGAFLFGPMSISRLSLIAFAVVICAAFGVFFVRFRRILTEMGRHSCMLGCALAASPVIVFLP